MKEIFRLFYIFAKIGITTFGGGYAMLPILEHEIVNKLKWSSMEELTNYYAVGQCTPGVISVNVATFIGYKRKGIIGAISATLGIVTPSIVIITVIAQFINQYKNLAFVQNAFNGIRVCVGALIISAILQLWKSNIPGKFAFLIFLITTIASLVLSFSPIILLIISGLSSWLFQIPQMKHLKLEK